MIRCVPEQRSVVSLLLLVCVIIVAGCGEGSPFEPQDTEPVEMQGALLARQFPTADEFTWEYISADREHSYALTIPTAG